MPEAGCAGSVAASMSTVSSSRSSPTPRSSGSSSTRRRGSTSCAGLVHGADEVHDTVRRRHPLVRQQGVPLRPLGRRAPPRRRLAGRPTRPPPRAPRGPPLRSSPATASASTPSASPATATAATARPSTATATCAGSTTRSSPCSPSAAEAAVVPAPALGTATTTPPRTTAQGRDPRPRPRPPATSRDGRRHPGRLGALRPATCGAARSPDRDLGAVALDLEDRAAGGRRLLPRPPDLLAVILVDPAVWPWRGRRWAHLVSDHSIDELHDFAARPPPRPPPVRRRPLRHHRRAPPGRHRPRRRGRRQP